MSEFRLTQISDTHLTRRLPDLTDNFERVSRHIDATRPDLVINTGDLAFDGPNTPDDLRFARTLHDALRAPCRYVPGNHDIGDNPTIVGPPPTEPVTDRNCQRFLSALGEDCWSFEAAGWHFIGLNCMVMNTGLPSEEAQFDWLAAQFAATNGRPVALFLHKPLFLNTPEDPELVETSIRYVPMPARSRVVQMFSSIDLRLVASGHVHQRRDFSYGKVRHIWAPSVGFVISDKRQEVIGIKEVGLVEYRFRPDSFEVRHVKAPGQIEYDVETLLAKLR
jgi:3',5'-cyclic AMP phosphodiesterase CpdA